MSSASTVNLPLNNKFLFYSNIVASGTAFNYTLTKNHTVPAGNYLATLTIGLQGTGNSLVSFCTTSVNIGGIRVLSTDPVPELSVDGTNTPVNLVLGGQTTSIIITSIIQSSASGTVSMIGNLYFSGGGPNPNVNGVLTLFPLN